MLLTPVSLSFSLSLSLPPSTSLLFLEATYFLPCLRCSLSIFAVSDLSSSLPPNCYATAGTATAKPSARARAEERKKEETG